MWRLASSPISDLKRLWVRDVFQTDRDCRWFLFGGLMTAMIRRLRFRKQRKQTGWLKIGQPWSYLRLEAYSFFGLCEGV